MMRKKKLMSIISFVMTLLLLFSSVMPTVVMAESPSPQGGTTFNGTDAEWEALRQSAKDRQRHLIFDNDGDDAAAFPKTQTPSIEKILAARTSFLNKYPVDTINYSITRGGFDYLTTRTNVGERAYAEGVDPNTYNYQILTKWLHEQNTDALTLQMNYARENNIELFACLRVNDAMHDYPEAPGNPHPLFSPFKRQHPELLLGPNMNTPDGTDNGSLFGKWGGYNFAMEAVRDRFYAVVDEVLTDYASASDGLDGISFDFHRESLLFKSAAQGKDVTDEERNALTELFSRIRTRAEEIGKQRGRPILIAVKLPDSVDYCMNAGIDLDVWMDNSLIDLVVGGSHVEPWGNMVEHCHSKNVKYYASLEGELHFTENQVPKAMRRNIYERYWAQMLAAMKAGVDGIQYFNLVQEFEVQEIMSLNEEALAYKPKRVFPTNQLDAYQEYWLKNGGAYSKDLPRLSTESPALVLSEKETELYLEVGDDLKAAEAAGKPVKVTVAVYGKIDNPQDLIMITGGKQATYQNSTLENIHYYTLPIDALSIGVNRISLTMPANGVSGETKDILMKGDTLLTGVNQLPWRRIMFGNPGGVPKNEEIINGTYCITDVGAKSRPNLHYSLAQQVGGYTGENPFLANFSCKVESATDERSVVFYVADGSYVTEVSLMHGKVSFLGTDASYSMDTTDKMHSYQLKITNTKAFLYVDGGSQPILETLLPENRKVFSEGTVFNDVAAPVGNLNTSGLLFGSLSYNGASKAYWQNIEIVRPQNSAWVNDLNLQISYGSEDPKGKLLFEDDCSDFTAKGWNFAAPGATSVGNPVYSVDAKGNSNNPTTPNKLTAPNGQYLAFCEGQSAVNYNASTHKVISGIEDSWTLEFRAKFADLIKTKPDIAPDGKEPWNGFRVEMNANKRQWRVNFTQGDKVVMLNPVNSNPTEPVIEYNLLDDEFHTYTIHYDGKGNLKIGVDGMLLGNYPNPGKATSNQNDWVQFFNESYSARWASGNNEVYIDHLAIYTNGDPGFKNEGKILFEDDCSSFTAKSWNLPTPNAAVAGKPVYSVDGEGNSNNPTTPNKRTAPDGQYLVFCEGQSVDNFNPSFISKAISGTNESWTLELKARFADLVKTKAANAPNGADPWNGFRVEMYINNLQWRVNFTQGNRIVILDTKTGHQVIEYNLIDDKIHTYTIYYDGNGNLKIGVDGILLGSYSHPGITKPSPNTSIQFHNVNLGTWWASDNNEVYLDNIALYADKDPCLKQPAEVTMSDNSVVYNGEVQTLLASTKLGEDPLTINMKYLYEGIDSTVYPKTATAPTNAGTYKVAAQIADNEYTGSATATLIIEKATITTPDGITGTLIKGQSLADTSLSVAFKGVKNEQLTGTIVWASGNDFVPTETGGFAYTFTPNSPNYLPVTGTMTVTVNTGYTITYNANGGSGTMTESTVTSGDSFTLPANGFVAPNGKQFKEWAIGSTEGIKVKPGEGYTFTASTTVYAVWEDITAGIYTVIVNDSYAKEIGANNGAGSYALGTTVTINAGSRSNHRFAGWTTTSDAVTFESAGEAITTFAMPAEDVIVTAKWSYNGTPPTDDRDDYTPPAPPAKTITVSEMSSKLFSGSAGQIGVSANMNNAFTNSVELKVTDTNADAASFGLGVGNEVYPFDISLYIKGTNTKTKPVAGYAVTLSLPVPKNLLDKKDQLVIMHKSADGKVTTLSSKLEQKNGIWFLVFETTDFSPYALVVRSTNNYDVSAGVPYYLDGDNRVFIGFVANGKYIAPKGVTVFVAPNSKSFTDVSGHLAAEDIDFITERELFVGTGGNRFSPDLSISRSMFATVLGRLYERSYGKIEDSNAHTFTDCDYKAYYGKYVDWAAKNNIIAGYGNGKFGPDDQITREQMVTMLYRFANFHGVLSANMDTTLNYSDSDKISDYAKKAVLFCQTTGVISGRNGGMFIPQEIATRAEVSILLHRFVNYVIDKSV